MVIGWWKVVESGDRVVEDGDRMVVAGWCWVAI